MLNSDLLLALSRDLADNKVFFQHPDLMRSLGIHETVMQLMINTLNKAQQQSVESECEATQVAQITSEVEPSKVRKGARP